MAGARKIPKKPLVAEAGSRSRGPRRLPASAPFPAKPTPAEVLVSEQPTVFYVGVGASAGGLDPMEDFFRHMPSDSGMVFVVVSHQHAGHVSHLPSLLGKCTAMPVAEVVDVTGAGDLFAAGFLHGIASGRSLEDSGRLGSMAAAEIISHFGAHPQQNLSELARSQGLM